MRIELTTVDWSVIAILLTGSLFLGLYIAYRAKAGENSTNFSIGIFFAPIN